MPTTRWGPRLRHLLLGVPLVAALTLAAACGGDDDDDSSGGNQNIGSVDVIGLWGGDELTSFETMVKGWSDSTGGTMNFTGTRNITADLTLRVEGGNPPDVAIPAEIGLFQQFAREGKLTPLSACSGLENEVKKNYPKAFVDLGTVDGKLYGFFMKADTKGTVWYNPTFFKDNGLKPLNADNNFDDLLKLSRDVMDKTSAAPWSVGVEQAEGTGWPGTDWIQQIILNEMGEDVYDGLIDGSVKFTDNRVKQAWEKFGEIVHTDGFTSEGSAAAIISTSPAESTYPVVEAPPTAAMVYLGGFASGFITEQFPDAKAGQDFDFFTFPGGKITGSANIVYAFNDDATTCSYLKYLASADGQQSWVDRGGFTSVNKKVSLDSYPDEVARKQAQQLLDADSFRFDLDDAIGGELQQAYFEGVTQYIRNAGQLDSILSQIEATRGQSK